MSYTNIFINFNADSPSEAPVRSQLDNSVVRVPDAVKSDVIDYALWPVDGAGNYLYASTMAAAADIFSMTVGVGPVGGTVLTSTTAWAVTSAVSGAGFIGALSYGAAVSAAIGALSYIDSSMEIRALFNTTSHAATKLQSVMKLLNRVNS